MPGSLNKFLSSVLVASAVLAVPGCAPSSHGSSSQTRRVLYNLDSSEFFVGTFGPVASETIDRFVAEHARAGVTDLFINVNAQRTNYDSDVWEAAWEERNPDAPKVDWITNTGVLHNAGIDYPARMIAQARANDLSAWISIRMNDAHLPNEPEHPLHSDFWRAHPEWRLANTGLDFEVDLVREHYIKLIREIAERYDIDGIELDFLRFRYYFRDGREAAGTPLMTDLVTRARELVRSAEARLGRDVSLAVRVPTSPHVSKALGLDAIDWAHRGLVDLVIASPFWSSSNTDIRVEEWMAALEHTDVELAVSSEDGVSSGGVSRRTMTRSEMRAMFASVLHRGAHAYFFNLFTTPWQSWSQEDYFGILREAGSIEELSGGERRHVVTIADPWVPGEKRPRELLPVHGLTHDFQIHIGPVPADGRETFVELVIDDPTNPPVVEVNDTGTTYIGVAPATHLEAIGVAPALRPSRSLFKIPQSTLRDGYNAVRVAGESEITVRWVEIRIDA